VLAATFGAEVVAPLTEVVVPTSDDPGDELTVCARTAAAVNATAAKTMRFMPFQVGR
jgi:hypothetical protein